MAAWPTAPEDERCLHAARHAGIVSGLAGGHVQQTVQDPGVAAQPVVREPSCVHGEDALWAYGTAGGGSFSPAITFLTSSGF